MSRKILLVDRNKAFATMLEQMLEMDGGYEVQVAHRGSDALSLLDQTAFDLTIIDMDLDARDMDYHELVLGVRQVKPAMRLMLIPLMGSDLPPEALQLDIQGTLSKPFFADNLLPNIRTALAQSVKAGSQQPTLPAALPPTRQTSQDVQATLSELAHEINAEAVILLSTGSDEARILAQAGSMTSERLEKLAALGLTTLRAAQEMAQFLGQPNRPFEHNMFESDWLRLYMMIVGDDELLLVVTPTSSSLGTIRHNLRRAARLLTNQLQA
jgi:CheY-like chemotaxis protein/predicted regulator of Ras-like GTPase activity (Roadblock/LC7/MglB family)